VEQHHAESGDDDYDDDPNGERTYPPAELTD
jgi:hypothetical protein